MENYDNIEIDSKIKDTITKVIQDIKAKPLYHEAKHNVEALNYPQGAMEYYTSKKYELIKNVGQRSMIGNAWRNDGCFKIHTTLIFDFYYKIRCFDSVWNITKKTDKEFIDFMRVDLTDFMRDYYAYNQFLKEIMELTPNPISLGFKLSSKEILSVFDKFRKDGCIAKETDFDYFKYAFKGDTIPTHKQPFQPIKWIETKNRLYYELQDVERNYEGSIQKSLSNPRKKVQFLFINKDGQPMKQLSTPK